MDLIASQHPGRPLRLTLPMQELRVTTATTTTVTTTQALQVSLSSCLFPCNGQLLCVNPCCEPQASLEALEAMHSGRWTVPSW